MTSTERRHKLSRMLHEVLGTDNVYYDPPESVEMDYPAIVYVRAKIDTREADNLHYLTHDRYTITYIRKSADDDMVDRILELPYCYHDRPLVVDNLHQDVFTIYV